MAHTYIEATEQVRRLLRTEAFPVGSTISIPTIREITGVSHHTAASVMRQLAGQGEVEIRSGDTRGSIVLPLPEGDDEVSRLLDELSEQTTRASAATAQALDATGRIAKIRAQLARATHHQRGAAPRATRPEPAATE